MPKAVRLLLIILGGIILLVLLAALILFLNGKCFQKYTGADESLSDWMSRVSDDAPLNRVVMPGSHDAGTAGILWPGETQTYTVAQQLASGARYFDLRVHKKDDGSLVIYHDVLDGTDFIPVLDDVRDFILAHPTEVLLLDFQHFNGSSQSDVLTLLREKLYDDGLLVENTTEEADAAFIRGLTMGDVRGKCVVFWGDRSSDPGEWVFLRSSDECPERGLCLDSYYISDIHKSSTEVLMEDGFPTYFGKVYERQAEEEDGIFVLQCQLTDGKVVFGPWSRERGHHDRVISDYIRSLPENEDFEVVNVILRDFLTPEKCADIINLNEAKGYMEKAG